MISPTNSAGGRRFARAVARMVLALDPPAQVKMLALPGLDEGDDIGSFEWKLKLTPAEQGERIKQLADGAPLMRPRDVQGWPLPGLLAHTPPAAVRWLWPGRVPIGKPMVIYGGLDAGKSIIALDLAARVSAGAEWPGGYLTRIPGYLDTSVFGPKTRVFADQHGINS